MDLRRRIGEQSSVKHVHSLIECWQKGTFLIEIGADINRKRDDNGKNVLSTVEDKVVQDVDGTEGTGVSESNRFPARCKD